MPARRWYSPGEIARTVGVDRRTVTRWIREGKLQADRPHPHKRYAKVTAEQFAEAAKSGSLPALTAGWMAHLRARVVGATPASATPVHQQASQRDSPANPAGQHGPIPKG
jgi:excisionase family DNA binding protein